MRAKTHIKSGMINPVLKRGVTTNNNKKDFSPKIFLK